MKFEITNLLVYRYRYYLGYLVALAIILAGFFVAWQYIPGGLSTAEQQSTVETGLLSISNFTPNMVIDLPFHLLQRASFNLFEITIWSIKLPSIILALLTVAGLYGLLRSWFKNSVAIPTTLISVTTPQFIAMAQTGTPLILFTSLVIWLLLAATMVAWQKQPRELWQLVLVIIIGLLLYVPLGIYPVIALAITTIAHPRARRLVSNLPNSKLLIGGLVVAGFAAPIIYAMILDISTLRILLGVPAETPNILNNAILVFNQWFNFYSPTESSVITPVYAMAIVGLMAIGAYRLFRVRYTARSYITTLLMFGLLAVAVVNPDLSDSFFIVMCLLIARAISLLLTAWWYRLFPYNPYARLVGLAVLTVLVFGIAFSNVYRYAYGTLYSPLIFQNYSKDLAVLTDEISTYNHGSAPVALVVSESELPFYELAASFDERYTIIESPKKTTATKIFITKDAKDNSSWTKKNQPEKILTTTTYHAADRFYVYNNGKK